MSNPDYLFTSERLGFRHWQDTDREPFALMNSDPEVMRHFPSILTRQESDDLFDRLVRRYEDHGYTYFVVELLENAEFIGFIGLSWQDYPTEFNPSTDIGWRLKRSAWRKGFASEGAQRCLEYGFKEIGLDRITSACPKSNISSEQVMKKIGMKKKGEFEHPNLVFFPEIRSCMWYELLREEYLENHGKIDP